jgi:hypothetical protein
MSANSFRPSLLHSTEDQYRTIPHFTIPLTKDPRLPSARVQINGEEFVYDEESHMLSLE